MYKAVKNTTTLNRPKNNKQIVIKPITEWSVRKDDQIIVHIPDWYSDPKAIAYGLAEILNKNRKIKLPLNM